MKRQAGSVLVLALWTLLVLGFLALAVGGHVSASTRAARFLQDDATALSLARGGMEFVMNDIMNAPSNFAAAAAVDTDDTPSIYRDNDSLPGGTFSVYYTFDDTNVGGVVTNFGVLRESDKIRIDEGPNGDTQRLAQALDWLGASPGLAMDILSNYPSQKTVAPEYVNRYGPYEALPELLAVPGLSGELFEGLEPLVTLREFERRYPDASEAWLRRESFGGVAEGRALVTDATGATRELATRRITFVFDRATTNLLYWREH